MDCGRARAPRNAYRSHAATGLPRQAVLGAVVAVCTFPVAVLALACLQEGNSETSEVTAEAVMRRDPEAYISVAAAEGLGRIGNAEAIPRIVAAAERGPEVSLFFARALLYFDERTALAAARELLTDAGLEAEEIMESLRAEVQRYKQEFLEVRGIER